MVNHLSYSAISTYLACPESWRRKYLAKEKTYSTPELALGSAVHNAVEEIIARKGDPLAVWPGAWERALAKGDVFWGHERPEEYFNEGVRLLVHPNILSELARLQAAVDEYGPRVERQVTLRVPGVPVPIIGYVDIVTADGVPGDFKTSSKSWSSERAAGELQSLFYLAALNQAGQTVREWKFRHFVIVKTKEPKFQTFEHYHNPGQIMFLFDTIQRVWRSIEAEIFPLNPGSWKCSPLYCDFFANCRGRYDRTN